MKVEKKMGILIALLLLVGTTRRYCLHFHVMTGASTLSEDGSLNIVAMILDLPEHF